MENGASGEEMGLDELIRRPDSVSAARLAGHKNFVKLSSAESGAFVPDWGLSLPVVHLSEPEGTLCIPQSAIDFSGNEYVWRVRRVIADVDHVIVLLSPDGAQEQTEQLRAELLPKQAPEVGSVMRFSLRQEKLLVY